MLPMVSRIVLTGSLLENGPCRSIQRTAGVAEDLSFAKRKLVGDASSMAVQFAKP